MHSNDQTRRTKTPQIEGIFKSCAHNRRRCGAKVHHSSHELEDWFRCLTENTSDRKTRCRIAYDRHRSLNGTGPDQSSEAGLPCKTGLLRAVVHILLAMLTARRSDRYYFCCHPAAAAAAAKVLSLDGAHHASQAERHGQALMNTHSGKMNHPKRPVCSWQSPKTCSSSSSPSLLHHPPMRRMARRRRWTSPISRNSSPEQKNWQCAEHWQYIPEMARGPPHC